MSTKLLSLRHQDGNDGPDSFPRYIDVRMMIPTGNNNHLQHGFRVRDEFSSIALKYRFLFNLEKDSRILLVGPFYQNLSEDLAEVLEDTRSVTYRPNLEGLEQNVRYDLVCLDVSACGKRSMLARWLQLISIQLAETGTLVLAAGNRLSIDRIISLLQRKGKYCASHLTTWGYQRLLRSVGLSTIHEFMVLPSLYSPEEYHETTHGREALPAYVSLVHRLFSRFRLYKYVHRDYLYVASRNSHTNPFTRLILAVNQAIAGQFTPQSDLLLERFDMRSRGALLLLMSDAHQKNRIVVRFAVSDKIDTILARNKEFTDKISSLQKFDRHMAQKVPKTISQFTCRGYHAYVENQFPGALAWKVENNHNLESVIFGQACEFIYQFNLASKTNAVVDDMLYGKLIGNDLNLLKNALIKYENAVSILEQIFYRLLTILMGKQVTIVWGHGDFGYGNILINRDTGQINGIIDWDTHVQFELPGVDLTNLLLQKSCSRNRGDLSSAIKEIRQHITATGKLNPDVPDKLIQDFGLTRVELEFILCIAGIRMLRRSIPYQTEFIGGIDQCIQVIQTILAICVNYDSKNLCDLSNGQAVI